jgi:hypothetical protein
MYVGGVTIPDPIHVFSAVIVDAHLELCLSGELWTFDTTEYTVGDTDDGFLGDATLHLPLMGVCDVHGMRFALDSAGIVWISHYLGGSPAVDGRILHRPGHRDAMMTTHQWAPGMFRLAFKMEPRWVERR